MSKRAWETETSRGGEKQSIIKKEEMEKKKKRKSQNTRKKHYGVIFASVPTPQFPRRVENAFCNSEYKQNKNLGKILATV